MSFRPKYSIHHEFLMPKKPQINQFYETYDSMLFKSIIMKTIL